MRNVPRRLWHAKSNATDLNSPSIARLLVPVPPISSASLCLWCPLDAKGLPTSGRFKGRTRNSITMDRKNRIKGTNDIPVTECFLSLTQCGLSFQGPRKSGRRRHVAAVPAPSLFAGFPVTCIDDRIKPPLPQTRPRRFVYPVRPCRRQEGFRLVAGIEPLARMRPVVVGHSLSSADGDNRAIGLAIDDTSIRRGFNAG